jgi:hypothetical protein
MTKTPTATESTHSAERHEARNAWFSSIESIERILPFCRNLITEGLGGHYSALVVQSQTSDSSGNCREQFLAADDSSLLQANVNGTF